MLTIDDVIERFDGSLAYSTNSKEICQYIADLLKELKERRKAPEIITCKDCQYFKMDCQEPYCRIEHDYTSTNGYCHHAKGRKGKPNENNNIFV